MRISTNTFFDQGIGKITTLQADQSRLQGQIATGKRFSNPSEDPVAAARCIRSFPAKRNECHLRQYPHCG